MSEPDIDLDMPVERFCRDWPRLTDALAFALFTTPLWARVGLLAWDYWRNT